MMRRTVAAATVALITLSVPSAAQLFDRTDAQREIELGRQTAAEVERQIPLSRDAAMIARVRRIGSALVAAMPQRAYPYQFTVLDVQQFNAFCLPGGFMYVFEGLLDKLPDDDAVAFVMGHEITHASHRHWKRMIEKMRGPAVLATLAGAALGDQDLAGVASALVEAQYSREQEYDADSGGIALAAAAGYDPSGAITAADVMAKLDAGDGTPLYLRSHPPARDRREQLERRSAELAKQVRAAPDAPQAEAAAQPASPAGEQHAELEYMPLEAGNEWTYSVRGASAEVRYRLKVQGRASTAAGPVWRLTTSLEQLEPTTAYWFASKSGVWMRPFGPTEQGQWSLVMPITDRSSTAGDSSKVEILSPETIATPCGRFDECLGVRVTTRDRQVETWYARGVGMVRRRTQPGGVVETLADYVLQAPMKTPTKGK